MRSFMVVFYVSIVFTVLIKAPLNYTFFFCPVNICSGRKYILKILSRLVLQRNEPAAGILLF